MQTLSELTRRVTSTLPGRTYTAFAMILMAAKGDVMRAAAIAAQRKEIPNLELMIKAATTAGSTADAQWAAPLANLAVAADEYVSLLRGQTILGRMAGVRTVPFQFSFPVQTAGAMVGWIGQGLSKPVGELAFEGETFTHSKISGIVCFSQELMRFSDPACETVVQNDLIAAIAQFSDQALLDPTLAAVADVSPASITYGAPSLPSSGSSAIQVEADLTALVALVDTNLASPYFCMRPSTALHLATLRTSGVPTFPNVSVRGGNIWGVPVLVSKNVPQDGDSPPASYIVLVDAAEMLLAEGGIELDASKEASLQLATDPLTGAQALAPLWQAGLVGCRAERLIRWQMRRENAVAVLTGVTY